VAGSYSKRSVLHGVHKFVITGNCTCESLSFLGGMVMQSFDLISILIINQLSGIFLVC
jgi:hypothetical protein